MAISTKSGNDPDAGRYLQFNGALTGMAGIVYASDTSNVIVTTGKHDQEVGVKDILEELDEIRAWVKQAPADLEMLSKLV